MTGEFMHSFLRTVVAKTDPFAVVTVEHDSRKSAQYTLARKGRDDLEVVVNYLNDPVAELSRIALQVGNWLGTDHYCPTCGKALDAPEK